MEQILINPRLWKNRFKTRCIHSLNLKMKHLWKKHWMHSTENFTTDVKMRRQVRRERKRILRKIIKRISTRTLKRRKRIKKETRKEMENKGKRMGRKPSKSTDGKKKNKIFLVRIISKYSWTIHGRLLPSQALWLFTAIEHALAKS